VPLVGLSYKTAIRTYAATLVQLKYPIITIISVVGFAFLSNYSGMSTTMAMALASTGVLFPFFSPVLGWLGVFLTGSDTSSNALFCKLQQTTAVAIGVDPVVTVAANASGGVTGKMISPQSIAIGAAAVGLVGKESQLFRFTVKHSFIMLFVVCLTTLAQAYAIQWIIPVQVKSAIISEAADSKLLLGSIYLGMLAVIVCLLIIFIIYNNRKSKAPLPVSIPS
jgi:lactate permease